MPKGIEELNAASSLSGDELLLTQQSSDDMKITINQIKDLVLESVFPVGSVYTQLPSQLDPTGLNYPGTWTNVSSEYSGDFFRVEGGDASAFESGEQLDQMQRITGSSNKIEYASDSSTSGAVSYTRNAGGHLTGSSGYIGTLTFDSANSPNARTSSTTDGETRPVNQTIRVWKRTA